MDLEHLQAGTILQDRFGNFRRVLAVVGGEGELTTYMMSVYSSHLDSNELKRAGGYLTAFELKERDYTIYSPEETIELNGKKYRKADVIECTKELEEVV